MSITLYQERIVVIVTHDYSLLLQYGQDPQATTSGGKPGGDFTNLSHFVKGGLFSSRPIIPGALLLVDCYILTVRNGTVVENGVSSS